MMMLMIGNTKCNTIYTIQINENKKKQYAHSKYAVNVQ